MKKCKHCFMYHKRIGECSYYCVTLNPNTTACHSFEPNRTYIHNTKLNIDTIKDLIVIANDKEIQQSYNTYSIRDCFVEILNDNLFIKAYLSDLRLDIRHEIMLIKSESFRSDIIKLKKLLRLKNNITIYLIERI